MTTLKDICERAGVSKATVSRVINHHPNVKGTTRAHVLEVMKVLNYIPSAAARSLSLQRSQLLGILLPVLKSDLYSRLLVGVDWGIRKVEYQMLLNFFERGEDFFKALALQCARHVDGLLIMGNSLQSEQIEAIGRHGVPTVLFQCHSKRSDCSSASLDYRGGGYEITRHLLSVGCRRILVVTDPYETEESREFMEGYKQAVRENGLGLEEKLMFHTPGTLEEVVSRVLQDLTSSKPPDAVMTFHEDMALKLLHECRCRKICVPEQVAIASIGGTSRGEYAGLTTLEIPFEAIGEMGVELLMGPKGIPIQKPGKHVPLSGWLACRESTGRRMTLTKPIT